MRLRVDGREVEVRADAVLLDAIRAAGANVPTLCHDDRLGSGGACRVCLVAVDGIAHPVPACTTPVTDGSEVRTRDPAATEAARAVLELTVSALPARARDAVALPTELVGACERLGVGASAFGGERGLGVDDSHPYLRLDRDLCIACNRCVRMCDEIQGTFALTLAGRGFDTVVAPGAGSWIDSDCVACGACADACPTGAISEPGLLDPRPIDRTIPTTCGYCGVGCTLDVHVRDDDVAAMTPHRGAPVNRGHACVKGRFAHGFARAPDRLTTPLVRRNGRLREASWDEALALVGARLQAIRAAHGPDAIAGISSARATNEENYLMQKLMRVAIGTNNVDNCSRICHAPSAAGLTASFGLAGGTAPLDDLDAASGFLLAGANPTEAHPVVGARIKQRVIDGARLVVVDPRQIELARYADVHLRPRPGTNVAVFNALARVLLEDGLVDDAFVAARAEGLEELRVLLQDYAPDAVEGISGVPAEDLRAAARLHAASAPQAIVYGLGVTEHAHGTDGVRALANVAILTGGVGVPGAGIFPLRGQNNVQGASDVGALPDSLPGYQPVADADVRARFEAAWGVALPGRPGLRITELFGAALEGRVRALYVVGEDIAQTDPDTARIEAALDACELVVCQEIFPSRTAARADVVLPAASFLEKDGTFVNLDRRFQRVRPALAPPGDARTDFEVLHLVARALGTDLGCPTPAAAMDELASLAPLFAGISHARLDADGPLHWPCRSSGDPGEARLYLKRFATPGGRARLAARPYVPSAEAVDADYPLLLITGRRLEHYNAGTMTRRTDNLALLAEERVEIHPDDAARAGIDDGRRVRLASRRGEIELRAQVTDRVAPGQLFMAFHFPDTPANRLTSDAVDEVTSCPEYKVTAIRLSAAP